MNNLLHTWLHAYLGLSLREKSLLLVFTGIISAFWAVNVLGNLSEADKSLELLKQKQAYQRTVFSQADTIQADLGEVLQRFDPSATFDAARLAGHLDGIARQGRLSADLLRPYTEEGALFDTHQLEIQIKDASLMDLMLFTLRIEAESPYIKIHRMQMEPQKKNRFLMDSRIIVTSFELKPLDL